MRGQNNPAHFQQRHFTFLISCTFTQGKCAFTTFVVFTVRGSYFAESETFRRFAACEGRGRTSERPRNVKDEDSGCKANTTGLTARQEHGTHTHAVTLTNSTVRQHATGLSQDRS